LVLPGLRRTLNPWSLVKMQTLQIVAESSERCKSLHTKNLWQHMQKEIEVRDGR
jgi:hypothetical protein